MDKVLKRRLVGATILIALAVIFVPMLLVGPDRRVDGDGGRMDIPPMPDDAREVRRIPLDPRVAREPEAAPERRSLAEAPAEYQPPTIDSEIVLRPEPATEPAADAADRSIPAVVAEADVADEPEPLATPPVQTAPEPAAPVTAPVEPAVSMGDWAVQVASFGSAQSAAEVRDRLERLGHIVLRDEIVRGDSTLLRLRTGPYPSREAAEQARQQVATTVRGVDPIVIRLEGAAAAPDRAAGFAVQVGSFIGENNAATETERLKGLGFEAFRHSEEIGGRTVWKVLVGPVPERGAADLLRTRLAEQARVEGLVVSYP